MGSCFSDERQIEPAEIEDLNGDQNGGKISKNRELTDKFSLGLLGVYLLVFSCLVIYVATQGDLYRTLYGYDDCGNVCGRENSAVKDISCSGKDMTKDKYLLVRNNSGIVTKTCLENCGKNYKPIFHRCIMVNGTDNDIGWDFKSAIGDLRKSWGQILLLSLLALVYSIIMVVLLRYATKFIVWFMLIVLIVGLLAITIFLWVTWNKTKNEAAANPNSIRLQEEQTSSLIGAITLTIITVVVFLVILVMRKRIQLVIQLIKEAGKAIASMPLILFEPVLTFISLVLGAFIWLYFILLASSAGTLKHVTSNTYDYVDSGVCSVTMILSIFTAIWMFYFIVDCQHMIIAGSIARWFFTRDKSNLGSPILNSFKVAVSFHLGTIALGSFIITIFMIIKALIKAMIKSATGSENSGWGVFLKCCVNWCLETLEDLLKYFTRNAYIITAIYGYTFCQSGKRAFNVITNNVYKIIAINSVGDTVLGMAKIFIFFLTVVVGYEVLKNENNETAVLPLVLVGIFAVCIGHMFMTVYEMTIDTIFICFCEDYEENDGLSKPYYMSKELMEFVKKTHKYFDKDSDQNPQAV